VVYKKTVKIMSRVAAAAVNWPNVSNDSPFSEAQFKTLKYNPQFTGRFGSIQDARFFCQHFLTGITKSIVIRELVW